MNEPLPPVQVVITLDQNTGQVGVQAPMSDPMQKLLTLGLLERAKVEVLTFDPRRSGGILVPAPPAPLHVVH